MTTAAEGGMLGVEFVPPRREKIRALLIDDDAADSSLVARLAAKSKQLDVALTRCGSVEEARAALVEARFDVVYVDYWLGMDTSIAFIHDFARAHDVPCILLTGLDTPDIRRIAFRAGVEAFLSKDDLSTQGIEGVTLAVLRHHASLD